jgi:hypothetical protein
MGKRLFTVVGAVACLLVTLSSATWGESAKPLPIESLLGKFEGIIQVENAIPVEHAYKTEIVAVDVPANTVSLTAFCKDCGTRAWTRKNCEVQEVTSQIRFICKGPASDEAYIFDGNTLRANGFGNNYPYSIHTTKL